MGIYQVAEIKSSKIYAACSVDLASAARITGLQKNTQTNLQVVRFFRPVEPGPAGCRRNQRRP
jgi:hypothetical protein